MDFIQSSGVYIEAKLPRASDRIDQIETMTDKTRVGRFITQDRLQMKQADLLGKLHSAFDDDLLRRTIVAMTQADSRVSLRAVDWCVTNYAKKYDVCVTARNGESKNMFFLYKAALAHYRRRNFDPFRRRLRVTFELDGHLHVTTPGQLQFFLWAHNVGVLAFIEVCVHLYPTPHAPRLTPHAPPPPPPLPTSPHHITTT